MSAFTKVAFWLVVAAQVAILLAFVGVREYRLQTGTEVVLKTVPVDPRSLLQGDYAILRYEIGQLPQHLGQLDLGETVYVMLDKRDGEWRTVSYQVWKPEIRTDTLFIKGIVGSGNWLDFGIGTYFVPEGTGMDIQGSADVKVKVAIDANGIAAIKEVFVDGLSFTSGESLDAEAVSPIASPTTQQPLAKPTRSPEAKPTPAPER